MHTDSGPWGNVDFWNLRYQRRRHCVPIYIYYCKFNTSKVRRQMQMMYLRYFLFYMFYNRYFNFAFDALDYSFKKAGSLKNVTCMCFTMFKVLYQVQFHEPTNH